MEGIDHVAIAVDEQGLATARWVLEDVLGAAEPVEETLESQGVRTWIYRLGGAKVELLVPLGGQGPVARFLADRGQGLHHLAFEVEDVEAAIEQADKAGLALIDEAPRPGVEGSQIAFLHPRDTFGTLLEFVSLPEDPSLAD